ERRAHKTAPGGARQRTADADATHPEFGENGHGEIALTTDQDVDGLWRHRLDHGGDLFSGRKTGRIEAVSARFRKGLQPLDGGSKIGLADQKAFTARDQ